MKFDESLIIKILFASIIFVVILAIFLIVIIWKVNLFDANNQETNLTSNQDLGTFSYVSYTSDDVLDKYLDIINDYLYNADIDKLYELLSDDYKEEYSYSKENLYSNLSGKNVLGKQFTDVNYTASSVNGKTIYAVNMVTDDNNVTFDFNIIEDSPNNFYFSLDNFIAHSKDSKEQVINGVKLIISDITYYNNRIVTRAKLENSNEYNIYVNTQNDSENIYYRIDSFDNSYDYITETIVFSGKVIEISPYSDIGLIFDSKMSFSNFSSITNLVIKDVELGNNGIVTELVYDF